MSKSKTAVNESEKTIDDLDVKTVASIFNVTTSEVERLCEQGKFEGAYSINGKWLIPRSADDRLRVKLPTFGDRLKAVRRERKLTQRQLADALGCKEIGIGFFEADAALPSAEALKIIGEQFGLDIHELLIGQPAPQIAKEIEAVRYLKKQFRQILNEVGQRVKEMKKLDWLVGACIETIEAGLNPRDTRAGNDGE